MSAARSIPASTRKVGRSRSKPAPARLAPAQLALFSRSRVDDERELDQIVEDERWTSYE